MQPLKWFFDIIKQTKRSFILSHVCSYHTFEHIANLKKQPSTVTTPTYFTNTKNFRFCRIFQCFAGSFCLFYIFFTHFFRQSFSFFQISVRQTTDKQKTTRTTAKMNDKVLFRRKMISSLVNYQRCCFCFFFAVCYFWLTIFYLSSVNER